MEDVFGWEDIKRGEVKGLDVVGTLRDGLIVRLDPKPAYLGFEEELLIGWFGD